MVGSQDGRKAPAHLFRLAVVTGYREHGSTEPRSVAYDNHWVAATPRLPEPIPWVLVAQCPVPCSHHGSTVYQHKCTSLPVLSQALMPTEPFQSCQLAYELVD